MTASAASDRKAAVAGARRFLRLRKRALVATHGRSCGALGPTAAAASAVIGATLGRVPGLIEQLLDAGPVVIVVEAADDDWAAALGRAVRDCVLTNARLPPKATADGYAVSKPKSEASRPERAASPVRVFSGPCRISEKESKDALASIGDMSSVVAIAREPNRELPPAVLRAADHRLVACRLDADLLALVVAAVTGSRPKKSLPAELLRLADLDDIRLALHRDRGPDGCIDRLEQLTTKRATIQAAGPRLSELVGYGAARDVGLAIAADLQAYKSGLPWAQIEKGILLFGPPGTGKTLYAKALASQTELPFLVGSLAQWQAAGDGYLGALLKAMRSFFTEARARAPAIAFVDEIDSFGARGRFGNRDTQYWTQAITAFLECLDGTFDREGVFVVGATNNPDALDPAIVRSGRFDRRIEIPLPGFDDLRGILRHHLEPDLPDIDLGEPARRMLGGSGADCANVVRRARGIARRAGRPLSASDLLVAIRGIGEVPSPETERRTAIHEAGHAVVAHALRLDLGDIGIRSPSGTERGFAYVNAPAIATRETLRDFLAVAMAGRAAEVVVLGEPSAGAAADLAGATEIATKMHGSWGLGPWLSVQDPGRPAARLHALVETEIREALGRATSIVERRRRHLGMLADALIASRALTGAEAAGILDTATDAESRISGLASPEADSRPTAT